MVFQYYFCCFALITARRVTGLQLFVMTGWVLGCQYCSGWWQRTITRAKWQSQEVLSPYLGDVHLEGRAWCFPIRSLPEWHIQTNPFHMLVCGVWCFHVPQRHLMLLKHHNSAVVGITRFSLSWACNICQFIWQEELWFVAAPSTSQVKQKNILIVVMCCHLYTRETIREKFLIFCVSWASGVL